MSSPLEILQKYWKHPHFRDSQEAIITSVIAHKDVIALLPTGGGKSVCFQIPALIHKGVCIVISPLVALMQDQVNNLTKKGIKAIALTSSLSRNEIVTIFDNLQFGNYKFLYLSPERLASEFIQKKISQLNINLIAIDEAHCISEWGHDFRPSYRNIHILKQLHPKVVTIALTASATAKVLKDIDENLQLTDTIIYKESLQRKNLSYNLLKTEDVKFALKQLLSKTTTPAIIYTSSRKATKNIADFLNYNNLESTFYHDYMQEAGRAGRNGKKASATIIHNEAILFDFKNRFEKGQTSIQFITNVYVKLNQYFQISLGEKPCEALPFNFQEFCQKYEFTRLRTHNAIQQLHNQKIIQLDESFNRKSEVTFTANHTAILDYCKNRVQLNKLIKLLLRSYGGIFDATKKIDEYVLAQKLGISSLQIIKQLKIIENDGFISYKVANTDNLIQFLVPRDDKRTINSVAKKILQHQKTTLEKTKAVIKYTSNTKQCRSNLLLSYFDEYKTDTCGICDVCLKTNTDNINTNTLIHNIISLLKEHNQLTAKEIVTLVAIEKNSVINSLQLLLDKNKIAITSQQKFELKNNE